MKIDIGKYPDTWWRSRIHHDYMHKKYGYDWSENKTKFESFLEQVEDTLQVIYNSTINQIVKHRKRRINVRIDPSDTWNMDRTLAFIILPMLKQLQETKQGAPYVDDEDVPENLRSTAAKPKENEWDNDSNHFKRWDWVMGEMIYAFTTHVDDDWEDQFHTGEFDMKWKKTVNGFSELYYGPNHTHVFDSEGYKVAKERVNNGFRLFGKYYNGLWD